MKKAILIILITFFTLNCSKDTNSSTPKTENEEQSSNGDLEENQGSETPQPSIVIKFEVDGLTSFDFQNAEAVSLTSNIPISDNGSFENSFIDKENGNQPILISIGDDILAGYFPEDLIENSITKEALLLFYFRSFPEFILREFDENFIKQELQSNSKYDQIGSKMLNALNNNVSPFDTDEFNSDYYSIVDEILRKQDLSSKSVVGEFKLNYERDGTISWEKQTPLFCSLGLNITNTDTNQQLIDAYMFEHQGFPTKPSAVVNLFYNYFNPNVNNSEGIQLMIDGDYQIEFTNGDASEFGTKVRYHNAGIGASHIFGILVPIAADKLLATSKCAEEINGIHSDLVNQFLSLSIQNKKYSKEEIFQITSDFSLKLIDALGVCLEDLGYLKYIKLIVRNVIKKLLLFFDLYEATLFFKDWLNSDISGLEIRHFDNGISYGNLGYASISEIQFVGEKEDAFRYEGFVEEKVVKYDVEKEATEARFLKKEELVPAQGLPFQVKLDSGDAVLNGSNPIVSDENGKVVLDGQLGNQDSQIEILPINTKTNIEPINIDLIIQEEAINITGTWNMCATALNQTSGPCGWDDRTENCTIKHSIGLNTNGSVSFNGGLADVSSYSFNDETLQLEWTFSSSITTEQEISEQLLEGGIVTQTQTITYSFQGNAINSGLISGVWSISDGIISNYEPYARQCSASYQVNLSR